ncbi:hypothetical protein KUTeg_011046 [Tegillarca granosa]|uniref:Uncharacterized protein n=1 Tax=Tegillarca granosa TaxID=220873 RepID=A0ABQ9F2S2_TEGGR|nr:hypothetical protein KUTeg_011046 [Tegillarca granosa]
MIKLGTEKKKTLTGTQLLHILNYKIKHLDGDYLILQIKHLDGDYLILQIKHLDGDCLILQIKHLDEDCLILQIKHLDEDYLILQIKHLDEEKFIMFKKYYARWIITGWSLRIYLDMTFLLIKQISNSLINHQQFPSLEMTWSSSYDFNSGVLKYSDLVEKNFPLQFMIKPYLTPDTKCNHGYQDLSITDVIHCH